MEKTGHLCEFQLKEAYRKGFGVENKKTTGYWINGWLLDTGYWNWGGSKCTRAHRIMGKEKGGGGLAIQAERERSKLGATVWFSVYIIVQRSVLPADRITNIYSVLLCSGSFEAALGERMST